MDCYWGFELYDSDGWKRGFGRGGYILTSRRRMRTALTT
jgi:hypothetical protein